jgi:hypothetical protein
MTRKIPMMTGMFLLSTGNMYPRLSLSTNEPAPTNPTTVNYNVTFLGKMCKKNVQMEAET